MNNIERLFTTLEPGQQKIYEKIGKKRGESAHDAYAARIADDIFTKLLVRGEASLGETLKQMEPLDKKDQKEIMRLDQFTQTALERGDYDLLDKMDYKMHTFEGKRHARALAVEHISRLVRSEDIPGLSRILSVDSQFIEYTVFQSRDGRFLSIQQLDAMQKKGMTYIDILTEEIRGLKHPILQRHLSPEMRDEETQREKETILSSCKMALLQALQMPKTWEGYISRMPSIGFALEEIVRRSAYLGVVTLQEIQTIFQDTDIRSALVATLAQSLTAAPLKDYIKSFTIDFGYVVYAQKARFTSIISQLLDTGFFTQEDIAGLQDQILERVSDEDRKTHVIKTLRERVT